MPGTKRRADLRPARVAILSVLALVVAAVVVVVVVTRPERGDDPATKRTVAPTTHPRTDGSTSDPASASGHDEPRVRTADQFCLAGRDVSVDPKVRDDSGVRWRRDLDEQFDRLDRDRWNVRDRSRLDHEESYQLARNVTTRDGMLAVRAVNEPMGGRDYTSGYLDTNGRYALPDTFRVEVRAKLPMERGMWASPLWLRPADRSSGEIDVVEATHQKGTRPRLHHTIHTDYGVNRRHAARRLTTAEIGDPRGTRWHTYTFQKTPGLMVVWVDGQVTASFCTGSPEWYDAFYEAGKQWNLRISLHVGGWGGSPDATTDWSGDRTTLLIDRVRTWVPKKPRSSGDAGP